MNIRDKVAGGGVLMEGGRDAGAGFLFVFHPLPLHATHLLLLLSQHSTTCAGHVVAIFDALPVVVPGLHMCSDLFSLARSFFFLPFSLLGDDPTYLVLL